MGPETQGFLSNTWYVAAWDHELIDGKLLARTILEKPVLLYKGDSGRVVALDNRCCHRGAKLSNGRLEGDDIRCMYHGLKFDPTGKCIQIPGQDNIPKGLGVRAYPVLERQHLVWIWMGDPAKADESQILDIPYLAHPAWRGIADYMHYDANYLLIVDNLSDFAHLAFVHTKTLGGSEEYAYKSKPLAIERLEDGFRVERWHMNAPCPPFHRKVVRDVPFVDRRNIGRMHVPGIFFLESLFGPAGQGLEKGNMEGAKQYRNCQFFTPETRRTTHFFWNYLHDYDLEDSTIALSLHDSMVQGFLEDKFIIEGQQQMLDDDPDFKMHAIVSDAPLAHFRRTLAKRMEEERREAPVATSRAVAFA
ncbi:MAG TPA: aromatic ring-hydroxylating dioxygenase subunit alpha [Burkholderiales bacterium]|nr:aromatic ring-hydroxylating dioxygenase subunit alpha [Burkholderiales bacterium]